MDTGEEETIELEVEQGDLPLSMAVWLDASTPENQCPNLSVLRERSGTRVNAIRPLQNTVQDHLVGLDMIERMGGYTKSLFVIRNRMPIEKKIRSGDMGEILATEYIAQQTEFAVPIKRLRYKDDRNMAMRGDDVIAFCEANGRTKVLKAEVKSREALNKAVIEEADDALQRHSARPNPATLAFISMILRREGRDREAEIVEKLQESNIQMADIEHLIFTLSGNDPVPYMKERASISSGTFMRHFVGLIIPDHQEFIKTIFEAIDAGNNPNTH